MSSENLTEELTQAPTRDEVKRRKNEEKERDKLLKDFAAMVDTIVAKPDLFREPAFHFFRINAVTEDLTRSAAFCQADGLGENKPSSPQKPCAFAKGIPAE